MPMCNLIEYSDNYSDSPGSLWGFKRDDAVNIANVASDNNVTSFRYKPSLTTNTEQMEQKRE